MPDSASEGSQDEESIEQIPLKKRQKTGSEQTGSALKGASAEEKALKLLSSKTFF